MEETKNDVQLSELCSLIFELIDDYCRAEIRNISSADFYTTLADDLAEHLYQIFSNIIDAEVASAATKPKPKNKKINEMYFDDLRTLVELVLQYYQQPENATKYNFCKVSGKDIIPIIPRQSTFECSGIYDEKENITATIQCLLKMPQPKQKTAEWYECRNNLITASNLWKVFGTENQRASLMAEKMGGGGGSGGDKLGNFADNINSTLHWGNKFEPLSVVIYQDKTKTRVGDFGCIIHDKYKFIGASPDGIVVNEESPLYGYMLEIKNIVNRDIDGIPKKEYWIQTQIQMETCNLDNCHFVETRFKMFDSAEIFYTEREKYEYSGVILYFTKKFVVKICSTSELESDSVGDGSGGEDDYEKIENSASSQEFTTKIIKLQSVSSSHSGFSKFSNDDNAAHEKCYKLVEKSSAKFPAKDYSSYNKPYYVYMPIHIVEREQIDTWIEETKKTLADEYCLVEQQYWYLDEYSCVLIKRNCEWFEAVVPDIQLFWNDCVAAKKCSLLL